MGDDEAEEDSAFEVMSREARTVRRTCGSIIRAAPIQAQPSSDGKFISPARKLGQNIQ